MPCIGRSSHAQGERYYPLLVSVDHVIPLARGGLHRYENVACAWLECNVKKGISETFAPEAAADAEHRDQQFGQ
ncbi:MAG: HNH endonuclease [Acetobacteraceae bacterium]|nr:HNH endonuclease [Acetobacteraceae bacterium]